MNSIKHVKCQRNIVKQSNMPKRSVMSLSLLIKSVINVACPWSDTEVSLTYGKDIPKSFRRFSIPSSIDSGI